MGMLAYAHGALISTLESPRAEFIVGEPMRTGNLQELLGVMRITPAEMTKAVRPNV